MNNPTPPPPGLVEAARFDHDTAFMVLCAMRYCMGRQSYAVGICCDWIAQNWYRFSEKDQALFITDLDRELRRYGDMGATMGDGIDERAWRQLLDYMNNARLQRAAEGRQA